MDYEIYCATHTAKTVNKEDGIAIYTGIITMNTGHVFKYVLSTEIPGPNKGTYDISLYIKCGGRFKKEDLARKYEDMVKDAILREYYYFINR